MMSKKELNHDVRDWAGLPVELLEKIYSSVLCKDGSTRFRFSLTCKSWQSIRGNRHLQLYSIPTHSIQSAQKFQQVPLLICKSTWKKNDAGRCKLFHPIYKETYVLDYPELAGASILHSKYGWLLMYREDNLFFFNPFSRTIIDIEPKLDDYFNITFTAPPTSPDCILFSYENSVCMYYFHLGQDEDWRSYKITYKNKVEFRAALAFPICSPVYCNGGFYWFDIYGKLWFFNIEEEEDNDKLKKVVGKYVSDHRNYTAEYNGELYIVAVGKNGSHVRVFKLDCNGAKFMSLDEVKTLGKKTIYISNSGTLLVTAKVKGTEDKIYFPRFVGDEGIYYCLRTCRYYSFGCSSSWEDWNGTKVRNHCAWIEPDTGYAVEEEA